MFSLAPACRGDSSGASGGVAPAASSAAPKARPAAPPPVKAEEARALLDRWLAAQNDGQFDAYAALYASRFEGVRRSGPRIARLDRDRWLKEREAMFRKKMAVEISDVTAVASATGATLSFTQKWSSGTYTDEGPKLMVLARSGGALLIGREEMLRSTLRGPGAPAPLPLDRFAVVVRVPPTASAPPAPAPVPWLVLDASPKDEWGDGAPWLVARGDPVTVRRSVDARKLPAGVAAWRGRRVELFGKAGRACEADVTSFSLLGRVTPHFGTIARWDGKGDFQGGEALSEGEIAQEAWELTAGGIVGVSGRLLVAQLAPVSGSCDGTLWGRPAGGAPLSPVEATPADAATQDRALAELRKLAAYAEIQKEYEQVRAAGDAPRWEELRGAKPDVRVMAYAPGTSLVTVSVNPVAGCGDFGATMSAAWEMRGSKLTLVKEADGQALAPLSAVDVDGDGRVEMILEDGILRSSGTRYDRWERILVPFLDCGC